MPMYHCIEDASMYVVATNKDNAIEMMECEACIVPDCTGPVNITKYEEDAKHG